MTQIYHYCSNCVNDYCCGDCYAYCCYTKLMIPLKDRVAEAISGISQSEVAKRARVSQQYISKLVGGKTDNPGVYTLHAVAEASGYSFDWLAFGRGPKRHGVDLARSIPVVGFVGAGAEIFPIDDHPNGSGLDEIPAPASYAGPCVAVEIRGDSMYPMKPGWRLIYARDQDGVPDSAINKLCVCRVHDGPTFVKELQRGSKKRLFRLVSWNAAPIEDVKLDWAAPVIEIRPM